MPKSNLILKKPSFTITSKAILETLGIKWGKSKSVFLSFILFLYLGQYCKAQIILFGIDITKGEPYVNKKIPCTPNPYFIFADVLGETWVKFQNYTAKVKTPQMKEPQKYMKELYTKLSKTLGEPFKILKRSDTTMLSEDHVVWRFKYHDIFYFISLHPNPDFGPFMHVAKYKTYDEMVPWVQWATSSFNGIWNENDLYKFPEYVPVKQSLKSTNSIKK